MASQCGLLQLSLAARCEQVVCDAIDPDAAVVMIFYKWHNTPAIQLLSSLDRTATATTVRFSSVHGFPFQATFRVSDAGAGSTAIALTVSHAVPSLLEEWVGTPSFERHVGDILAENCEARPVELAARSCASVPCMPALTPLTANPVCHFACLPMTPTQVSMQGPHHFAHRCSDYGLAASWMQTTSEPTTRRTAATPLTDPPRAATPSTRRACRSWRWPPSGQRAETRKCRKPRSISSPCTCASPLRHALSAALRRYATPAAWRRRAGIGVVCAAAGGAGRVRRE